MTRGELDKELDNLQRDLWETIKKNSPGSKIQAAQVEEFTIFVVLGIQPTWET